MESRDKPFRLLLFSLSNNQEQHRNGRAQVNVEGMVFGAGNKLFHEVPSFHLPFYFIFSWFAWLSRNVAHRTTKATMAAYKPEQAGREREISRFNVRFFACVSKMRCFPRKMVFYLDGLGYIMLFVDFAYGVRT